MERLSHILRESHVKVRKEKCERVRANGHPSSGELPVALDFTSVEKYFYDKQYESAFESIQKWSDAGRPDKLSVSWSMRNKTQRRKTTRTKNRFKYE